MNFYITSRSALALLRESRRPGSAIYLAQSPSHAIIHEKLERRAFEQVYAPWLHGVLSFGPTSPLHLRVSSAGHRLRGPAVSCHVSSSDLPSGALLSLKSPRVAGKPPDLGIYLDTPSLCILSHAAMLLERSSTNMPARLRKQMAISGTVLLASEFCGSYSSSLEGMLYGLPPLSNSREMSRLLSLCPRERGLAVAREALRWVHDGHDSPMEVLIDCLLGMPPRLGGLGLRGYVNNQALSLTRRQRRLIEHRTMTPDFYFESCKLVLEFDGNVHARPDEMREDRRRMQDYQALGLTALPVTYDNVRSPAALDRFLERMLTCIRPHESASFARRMRALMHDDVMRTRRGTLLSLLLPTIRRPEP